jgi:hypothetical protein
MGDPQPVGGRVGGDRHDDGGLDAIGASIPSLVRSPWSRGDYGRRDGKGAVRWIDYHEFGAMDLMMVSMVGGTLGGWAAFR